METYIKFKGDKIFLNKFTTAFLINWWNQKRWKGTSQAIDYGIKLYLDRDTIWNLILYLNDQKKEDLSFNIESLTKLAFSLREGDRVEFYFN